MKIAYNPITAEALTTAPANNDITFDLRGLNIFVRGVKFKGTDTTYSVFKKHTSSSGGGYNGLVPVPSYTSTNVRFLREDGTWQIMPDTKVTQSETTTANFRPVILGYQNSTDVSTLNQEVTNQVYTTTSVYVQPSTGFLYANKLFSGGKEVATKDSLDLSRYVTIDTTQNITSTKIWPSASSDLYIGYNSSNTSMIKYVIHTSAGWARGYGFSNQDEESFCSFGAYGTGETLLYQYVGNDYQNPWQKWNSTRSDLSIPLFINNNKVWHAGNDGEGSGMDADLIDGTHKKDLFTLLTSSASTNLSVTVGGTTKAIADLYATSAVKSSKLKVILCNSSSNSGLWNTIKGENSSYIGTLNVYDVYSNGGPNTCGNIIEIVSAYTNHWQPQLWFSSGKTGSLLHRNKNYNDDTWGSWYTILDSNNYTNYIGDGDYVTSLGTSGNYLTWTKNGTTNNITVPFATKSTWTTYMYYGAISNLNSPSTISTEGYRLVYDSYPVTATNQPVSQDNANSLLTLFKSKHGTSSQYLSQLAFPSNGRFYYRYSASGSFSAWKTIAFTTDVKDPTDYYWANIAVSTTSSTTTSPTFNAATVTKLNVKGSANSNAYITADTAYNMYFNANGISLLSLDGSGKAVRSGSGYASQISLGTSSVRWSNLYSVSGNFSGDVTANRIKITDTDAVKHIEFSRAGYNYLSTPSGGTLAINVENAALMASSPLIVTKGRIFSGTNNSTSLGDSTYRWSGLYSVLGNFSSNVTANGFIKSGSSDSYVLLGGGGHKALTDFAKGNVTINAGTAGRLAYYSSASTIDDYSSTVGGTFKPIFLYNGVPTECNYDFKKSGTYTYNGTNIEYACYQFGAIVLVYIYMVGTNSLGNRVFMISSGFPQCKSEHSGQTISKGGVSAARRITFYMNGTSLYANSVDADQMDQCRAAFTYLTS